MLSIIETVTVIGPATVAPAAGELKESDGGVAFGEGEGALVVVAADGTRTRTGSVRPELSIVSSSAYAPLLSKTIERSIRPRIHDGSCSTWLPPVWRSHTATWSYVPGSPVVLAAITKYRPSELTCTREEGEPPVGTSLEKSWSSVVAAGSGSISCHSSRRVVSITMT